MDEKHALYAGHIWQPVQATFHGGVPMPYIQEIFLLECHIAGTSYAKLDEQNQAIELRSGEFLVFKREPDNKYDSLAIMILEQKGRKLGYIPRAKNEVLARLMDAGKLVFGRIETVQKFGDWLKINVRVYMKD